MYVDDENVSRDSRNPLRAHSVATNRENEFSVDHTKRTEGMLNIFENISIVVGNYQRDQLAEIESSEFKYYTPKPSNKRSGREQHSSGIGKNSGNSS